MEKQKPEDSTQNQKSSGENRRVGRSEGRSSFWKHLIYFPMPVLKRNIKKFIIHQEEKIGGGETKEKKDC